MTVPEPRGCGVLEQSGLFQGYGLLLLFYLFEYFLNPFSGHLRPAQPQCFAALVQDFQLFPVEPNAEHIILWAFQRRPAPFHWHCIISFLLLQLLYHSPFV